jgi:hypothetical protein
VLTPTTIFAPGSLINPPDGGDGDPRAARPFAGPGGAPPGYGAPSGYAPFPGQEAWSAPGGYPPPGAFQGPGPVPGPVNGGFAGPGGYPPEQAPPPGMFPGPGGFAEQGAFPPGNAFPGGNGGFPGYGAGPGYGPVGYPPPGYGPTGSDHPYQGNGGAPFGGAPGVPPPGFPGGAGHGLPPDQQFPGQPPMPPGYAQAPGQDPRQQPHGWYGQEGFPPPGGARGPDGQPFPGGPGAPGPAGYNNAPGYPGPGGYPGPAGFPPGHGYPGPAGQAGPQGQDAFPGQAGYPVNGGFPGAAEPRAPYAEYQAWRPPGVPGGYPGPGGYGEAVHGGYAYVIREDDLAPPPSPRPSARERGQGLGEWSPANAGPAPGHPASGHPADEAGPYPSVRAITVGQSGLPWPPAADGLQGTTAAWGASTRSRPVTPAETAGATADTGPADTTGDAAPAGATLPAGAASSASAPGTADVDPALAYGPDDPAYGPPGLDWYKRDDEPAPRTGEDPGGPRTARGPFEPLRPGDREEAGYPDYEPADGEPEVDGDQVDISGYQSVDDEISELLDFGTLSDPEAAALDRITDLYLAAETISPASFDGHFDELLERQRQLISEYFIESGGLSPADAADPVVPAAPVLPAESPSSPTPLGFDTAASLAALRGELRNAD